MHLHIRYIKMSKNSIIKLLLLKIMTG